MMPALSLTNLAAYSVQVVGLAGLAGLLLALLRVDAPGLRYTLLRLTLAVCLLLPWLQTPHDEVATVASTIAAQSIAETTPEAEASPAFTISWTTWIPVLLIAGMALRLVWLAVGVWRLARLRCAGEVADAVHHAALQETMGTAADVRYVAGFAQPVTFGLRRSVVLLPDTLRTSPPEIREAVLAHELLHVQRRDWAWVLAEELLRAMFWFHPVMWWLISRVQLAREEVVDALVVARTGRRRAYLEALMAFANAAPTMAPAFARRRHLFRRIMLVSREDAMSAKRLMLSATAVVALMAGGGWYIVDAFPLREGAAEQILHKSPGPLETGANAITPENPVPRRVHHEPAQYPAEAAAENAWASVTLRITIDSGGGVAEARVVGYRHRIRNSGLWYDGLPAQYERTQDQTSPVVRATIDAAVAAVARWRYESPANAPIAFDTTFFFSPEGAVTDTPGAGAPPPPPPPPPPPGASNRLQDDKAIRVGGNIRPPTKIKDVRPLYPPEAQAARIQGVVIAEIRIDEAGRVSDATIVRSVPELDEAALAAIRQWEFQPVLLNGAPVPLIMVATVNFSLK